VKVVLFCGPTITTTEACEVLDAVCYAPAAQGDVYRAAVRHPFAIGIIDGYFDRVPAVWHKEILWAMSEGIHVFGSASMGALRAAELAPFGMVGIGKIYEAFRDGILEDDDEVAVVHAPAEFRYRVASDAMVNIRATLAKARSQQVLDGEACLMLERIAKKLFYPERSYVRVLELAGQEGMEESAIAAFRRWLPGHAVNQKREDALSMLSAIRRQIEANPGPKVVSYYFEETLAWETAKMSSHEVRDTCRRETDEAVLRELRKDPGAAERSEAAALGWRLAEQTFRRQGHLQSAAAVLDESAAFCEARGLRGAVEVNAWLERNRCGREELERMIESQSSIRGVQASDPDRLEQYLLAYLRWTGDYETPPRNANEVRQL
jgi:hypothetical protein